MLTYSAGLMDFESDLKHNLAAAIVETQETVNRDMQCRFISHILQASLDPIATDTALFIIMLKTPLGSLACYLLM